MTYHRSKEQPYHTEKQNTLFYRMHPKVAPLAGLLCIIAGAQAAVDFRNETVACVFREYATCYRDIAALGANFTVKYDDTVAEISSTCRAESKVQQCIFNVPPICNAVSVPGITNRINGFIHNLCTNNSQDQKSFLNSSVCYNKYYSRRYNCVIKHDAGKSIDAKSLCCSNLKTLRCMEEDLRSVCPRNFTEFQRHAVETYRSHHSFVCGPYLRYCGAAPQLLSTGGVMVSTFVSILFQRLR